MNDSHIGVHYEEHCYGAGSIYHPVNGTAHYTVFWESQGRKGLWNDKEGPQLNNPVWIFTMKNRFGWRDQKDTNISVSAADNNSPKVIITLPDNGYSSPVAEQKDDSSGKLS